jgi:hypothetical protein
MTEGVEFSNDGNDDKCTDKYVLDYGVECFFRWGGGIKWHGVT